MSQLWESLGQLWPPLLLLLVANGAPVLARYLLGDRWSTPLDRGFCLSDGRPLLGPTKSWRGLAASLLMTSAIAALLGIAWWQGALFALLAMAGDLLASFTKRRLAIPPQGRATGIDQIPEALLPLLIMQGLFPLSGVQLLITVLLFMLLEVTLSPLLYVWHLRQRPY